MPTVQRYGERRVGLGQLPGVRKTAAETALSMGAGVEEARAQTFETIGRLGGAVAQFAATEYGEIRKAAKDRADSIARLSWKNRLSKFETDTVYNTETGVMSTRGAAAQALPERVMAEYQKLAGEIEAGLTSDEQRLAFAADAASVRAQIYNTVQSHVSSEITKLEANELSAFVENQRSYAVANANDPRRVGQSLAEITAAIQKHGANVGMGPEQIESAITAQRSAVHSQVIDRFLTQGNNQAARVYFEETKGEISGESVGKIEKALAVGRVREESQKQSDAILAAGGTLTEQREKARQIDDPEVRDDVMSRLEHESAVREKVAVDQKRETMRGVYDLLDKTPDVGRIPANVWSNMEGSERNAVRDYARARALGEPVETNFRRYYSLMQMAASDPSSFAKLNLYADRMNLGDTEFKQLASMQLQFAQGDGRAANQELASFSTNGQILDDALRSYGFPVDAKAGSADANRVEGAKAQVRQLIDAQLQSLGPGAKPSPGDIRSIVDGILSTEAQKPTPSSWWGSVSNWWNGNDQRFLTDLTVADIPSTERRQIEDALRRGSQPVNDTTVLSLYKLQRVRSANGGR